MNSERFQHCVAQRALHYDCLSVPGPTASAAQKAKQSKASCSNLIGLALPTLPRYAFTITTIHHQHLKIPTFNLSLTLRNHAPSSLPPHNGQHNRTSREKHTKRHTKSPNSFGLETLSPTAARPPSKAHHRATIFARRKSHGERPRRLGRAGGRSAADGAAVEVADWPAEEDGDEGDAGEGQEEQGV
jgi:hypothetical protein